MATATKRRFVKYDDGIERCEARVTVALTRHDAAHFEKLAKFLKITFNEAVRRSAQSGIFEAQPLEDYGYEEPKP